MNGSKTQIIVAALTLIGVLGGALLANWDKLFPQNQGATPMPTPVVERKTSDSTPDHSNRTVGEEESKGDVATPASEINISGVWRDAWGFTSQITQQGNSFKYTAWGAACKGNFQSSGVGAIRGNIVESDYQSNYSQGRCSGTVSSDGRRMTSICVDTACGQFQSSAVRQ